ncbi:ABC transporter permease [Hymenobacter sp. BRD128]|uniref:ABC transporter permease n=1 Tax=Hymenobacter sp. BRD128 TaxID=2675878 RepID=UPI001566BD9C|nr:ABC transporter permease [Hymenobacter sp. BRD128]QKG55552.1 ABC transporter permease [Hymenobacter sp. BRD128]
MDKIWLIIQREYLTRVRKRSFLVISLLAPLLLGGTTIAVSKLNSASGPDVVAVHDASGLQVAGHLTDTEDVRFVPAAAGSLPEAQAAFEKAKPKQAALLSIPAGFGLDSAKGMQILAKGNVSLKRREAIRKAVNKAVGELKMARSGLQQATIDNLQAKIDLAAINLDERGGKRNDVGTTTAMAYFLSILVYMFIFIYGVQVMRGVSEEKSSRILEVMISSVKPFQLMIGKILGIAGVVLTQFALWLVLSWGITTVVMPLVLKADKPTTTLPTTTPGTTARPAAPAGSPAVVAASPTRADQAMAPPQPGQPFSIWSVLEELPIGSIIGGFLFYFLGGYLLYSAMFAAIGSAVDDQTDAQQFMFPVTIPLILSYIVSINVIINGDPNGPLAFWLSMIPVTSPIAMVMRLPFGVPAWQLALSGVLLIAGFVGTTWVAARIYRVGILMYGKKVTYKELSKWMFYKG